MSILRHCAFVTLFSVAVLAQSERGTINGLVSDPSGAVIAGAEVSVISAGTNAAMRVMSTASGEFTATNLLPGAYRVEVSAAGFKRLVERNVVVAASSSVRLDVKLQIGQIADQVEVMAVASAIQTDNAKVSTQVQNKLVDELLTEKLAKTLGGAAKPVRSGGVGEMVQAHSVIVSLKAS